MNKVLKKIMVNKGKYRDVVGMVLYLFALFLSIKALDYLKVKSTDITPKTMERSNEMHFKTTD